MAEQAKKISSLSVFFPCYNEEGNVQRLVDSALVALPEVAEDFEVIIVNDGSADDTGAIAEGLAEKIPQVKAVHHEKNRGYGAAVITGIEHCTKDYVFFTDGDGQFDLKEIPLLAAEIDEHDVVVGYRINRQDNFMRRLNAWCWTTLVNTLFRLGVRDVDCAFKLFKRERLAGIKLSAQGAMVSTELLAKLKKAGCSIKEVGVHHYPRIAGEQSGANIRVILRAFKELFELYRKLK